MNCPAPQRVLAALAEPSAHAEVLLHVEGCERCLELLERSSHDDPFVEELRRVDARPVPADAEPELDDPPPGYRIVRAVKRGGQGAVYEAIQDGTERRVALKALGAGALETARQTERFRREVRLASRLRHPGVVTLYEAGETPGGVPYFA
ncbi:MAG: hypothetical protein AAF682_32695, partial [Planctomycetota bacterium]